MPTSLIRRILPSDCHACGGRVGHRESGWRFPLLCMACRLDLRREAGDARLEPGLRLAWPYAETRTLLSLVKSLKYGGRDAALGEFCAALAERLAQLDPPRPWLLQPVPMPLPRRLSRGFNQSELLALGLARSCSAGRPLRLLSRRAGSGRQAGRSRAERLARAGREYGRKRQIPQRGTLVLVDDLCTTGATLRACRAALDPGRERELLALVLTRIEAPPLPLTGRLPPE